jgi:hypothetical protein
LFDGQLSLVEEEVHFEVDIKVVPVQMPSLRIPIAVNDEVQTEFQALVAHGVIAPVTRPTPWVSPF